MESTTIKKVGTGIIVASVAIGIILGFVFKSIKIEDASLSSYSLRSTVDVERVFNWVLMLGTFVGGILTGLFFHVMGTIVENLEFITSKINDTSSEKETIPDKLKFIVENHDKDWKCEKCGTYTPLYSVACKNCGETRV